MAEYISREDYCEINCGKENREGYKECINCGMLNVPSADVQPVKRGFWKALMMSEETGWDLSLTCGHDAVCEYVCSVCGKPAIIDEFGAVFLPDYCPYCGADMRGR